MKELLNCALNYPALLVVPACGFVLSLVILRIKKRYVKDGVLPWRLGSRERVQHASETGSGEMSANNSIDLEIALRKFRELGVEDGDLGYAYWYEVGQLLKRAAGMQARIDALSKELEQCRAKLGKAD
ncbi:hypothetical protein [Paraburkholderia azotifigens]|uniref:Uncharacterized protein n=1 Tax=Paraburkholderia azotifigens TaxID=2057004 RepID=A0ABU9RDR7_9BURK